jgi:hypothetical protein
VILGKTFSKKNILSQIAFSLKKKKLPKIKKETKKICKILSQLPTI